MIAAALVSCCLGAALPPVVEPARHRRYIIVARARPGRVEAPSAPRETTVPMLRVGPDPDAPYYGLVATFETRWRALHGY